jgi:hypothetical protein
MTNFLKAYNLKYVLSVQAVMAFTIPCCSVMKKVDVKVIACSFEMPYLF